MAPYDFSCLTEDIFFIHVIEHKPVEEGGVQAKFQYTPPRIADFSEEEKEVYPSHKREYDQQYKARCFPEFAKLAEGDLNADVYFALQPMWSVRVGRYTLAQVEVLVRAKNGRDAAPMPAFAMFQQECKDGARQFLEAQLRWAAGCAKQLRGVTVSVNVRPDELVATADWLEDFFVALHKDGCRNLVLEVTEYSPITPEVLEVIGRLMNGGVLFSLDDVNTTRRVEQGFAIPGHACTFEFAIEHANLFHQQKLDLQLACQVFNVPVHTSPGEVNKYFESFLLQGGLDDSKIIERRELIENWVTSVQRNNPSTVFVIEASVHPEDICRDDGSIHDRFPQIDFFGGMFLFQGGKTGGRCYGPDVFVGAFQHQLDMILPAPFLPKPNMTSKYGSGWIMRAVEWLRQITARTVCFCDGRSKERAASEGLLRVASEGLLRVASGSLRATAKSF